MAHLGDRPQLGSPQAAAERFHSPPRSPRPHGPFEPGSPSRPSANTRTATQVALEWLKWLRRGCFRYVYPAVFFCAALMRRGTVACLCYVLMTILLMASTMCFAEHKQHLYRFLVGVSLLFLVTAVTLRAIAEFNELSDGSLHSLRNIGFGGVGNDGESRRSWIIWVLPETASAAVGMANWYFNVETDRESSTLSKRQFTSRTVVGVLLVTIPALHCNAFSALYQLAITAYCIFVAWEAPAEVWGRPIPPAFQNAFLFVTLLHLLIVGTFSVPALADVTPESMLVLLGAEDSAWCSTQCLAVFLLLETLLWCEGSSNESTEPGSHTSLAKPSDIREEESYVSDATKEVPAVSFAASHQERAENSERSLLQRRNVNKHSPHPLASPKTAAATTPPRSFFTFAARRGSSMASLSSLGRSLQTAASRGLIPLASILYWPLFWPALPTGLFLLPGLALLHVSSLPKVILCGTLVFQGVCNMVIYVHNVYLMASESAHSKVPRTFTWSERLGLQHYSRVESSSPNVQRLVFVLAHTASMWILALAISASRMRHASKGFEEHGDWVKWIGRWVVTGLRLLTVMLVLFIVFFSDQFSIFSMGYIIWILVQALASYMAPTSIAGWECLHGHAWTWWSLLVYSEAIVLATFFWQVLAHKDFEEIGLFRSLNIVPGFFGRHLLVSVLSAVQNSAIRAKVKVPSEFLSASSLSMDIFHKFAMFGLMIIMFAIVLLPPKSLDGLAFLILFNITVIIQHMNAGHWLRITLLRVTAVFAAFVLLVRCTLLLCLMLRIFSDAWLREYNEFVAVEQQTATQYKLFVVAILLIYTSWMLRMCDFHKKEQDALQDALARLPMKRRTLKRSIQVAGWLSLRILMLTAYFLMQSRGALCKAQLLALLFVLLNSRLWDYTGAVISVCSVSLIFGQYLFRFSFVKKSVADRHIVYLGLAWEGNQPTVQAEFILLILGILQSALQHAARHMKVPSKSKSRIFGAFHSFGKEVIAYGPQIVAVLMVFTALVYSTAWAIIHIAAVAVFVISGDSVQKSKRVLFWLGLFAVSLVLSLVWGWALEVWLAPDTIERPNDEQVSDVFCNFFDGDLLVDDDGLACLPNTIACVTQQLRCGQDTRAWWGYQKKYGNHLLEFLVLFVVCLLRRAQYSNMLGAGGDSSRSLLAALPRELSDASQSGTSQASLEVPMSHPGSQELRQMSQGDASQASLEGATLTPKSTVQASHPSAQVHLDIPTCTLECTGQTSCQSPLKTLQRDAIQVNLEDSIGTPRPKGQRYRWPIMNSDFLRLRLRSLKTRMYRRRARGMYRATEFLLRLSMWGAFISPEQVHLISVGYMFFLFWHLRALDVHQDNNIFISRLHVLRPIRYFNLFVFFLWVAFQCPLAPCPFGLQLAGSEWTHLLSTAQCYKQGKLERGSEAFEKNVKDALRIVLRSIGIAKAGDTSFNWTPDMFWNFFVFVSATAHALVCSRWNRELSHEFDEQSQCLLVRQEKYVACLRNWRRMEMQRTEIKQHVLLEKLRQLRSYLNEVRKVWANKRVAFTEEEKEKSDYDQRKLDLALRSGADPDLVQIVLQDFINVVRRDTQSEDESARSSLSIDSFCRKQVDASVIAQLQDHELHELQNITEQELSIRKDKRTIDLLNSIHQLGSTDRISAASPQQQSDAQDVAVPPDAIFQPVATGSGEAMALWEQDDAQQSLPKLTPLHLPAAAARARESKSDTEDSDTSFLTAQEQVLQEIKDGHVSATGSESMEVPSEKPVGHQSLEGTPSEKPVGLFTCSWWTPMEEFLKKLLCKGIDDVLFYKPGHATYWSHRHGDGFMLLLWKALCSQTHVCVIGAAVIQFATYQSVAASFTVCLALLALMAFPHPPAGFWKGLQWYNLLVISAKMIYQLPAFCGDGGCQAPDIYNEEEDAPWYAVLGFRKIDPHATEHDLAFSSVFEAFAADLLVYIMLVFHWGYVSSSGRLADPAAVCESLIQNEADEASELQHCLASPSLAGDPQLQVYSAGADAIPSEAILPCASVSFVATPGKPTSASELGTSMEDEEVAGDQLGADASFNVEASSWQTWLAPSWTSFRRVWIQSAKMRKPAMDLYGVRTSILILCFLILLLGWDIISNSGWGITAAIAANTFRGMHVLSVVCFLALIVIDRTLYTSYVLIGHPEVASSDMTKSAMSPELADSQADQRRNASLLQKLLLVGQLMALHIICIERWVSRERLPADSVSMFGNPLLFCFYSLYMGYLALTALQQKYDVRVVQGGVGFTHSFTILSFVAYRVYKFIPFVEELRVLSDWTATETSLNFFMWMKLEDLQQSLYEVQMDMDWRREYPRAAPRSKFEKLYQGGLLLVGLFVLIVAPLMFFSTLNFLYEPNLVVRGVLSVHLDVSVGGGKEQTALIYESGRASIQPLGPQVASIWSRKHPELGPSSDLTVQEVKFPESSDTFWLIDQPRLYQLSSILAAGNSSASVRWSLLLTRNRTAAPPAMSQSVSLTSDQISELAVAFNEMIQAGSSRMQDLELNQSISKPPNLMVSDAWQPVLHLATSQLQTLRDTQATPMNFSFHKASGVHFGAALWTWHTKEGYCSDSENVTDCGLSLQVISDKEGPLGDEASSSANWSVMGIYLGVVYTVGRFLRMAFSGSSKRIIYEELDDTALLRDLCNGIYISRIHGLLESEYELYYELMHIYRSPMLLIDVSKYAAHRHAHPMDFGREAITDSQLRIPASSLEARSSHATPKSTPRRPALRTRASDIVTRWLPTWRSRTDTQQTPRSPGDSPVAAGSRVTVAL